MTVTGKHGFTAFLGAPPRPLDELSGMVDRSASGALGTNLATARSGPLDRSGGSWEPRDGDGYSRRPRSHRPPVDEIAIAYVAEALRAFNARCYLATSVMLGVASERVINALGRAIVADPGEAAQSQKLLASLTSRARNWCRWTSPAA
jgi:hypothetical protein